jgi:hypothetical protein
MYEQLSRSTKIRLIKSFTDMLMREENISVFGLSFATKSDDELSATLAGIVALLETIEENKELQNV